MQAAPRLDAKLRAREVYDLRALTSKELLDYAPANFALGPKKQGDYFPTTIGPYDYIAIEYGYKPISGSESRRTTSSGSVAV